MTTQSNQTSNYNNNINSNQTNIAKSPVKNFANLNDFIKGYGESDEPDKSIPIQNMNISNQHHSN